MSVGYEGGRIVVFGGVGGSRGGRKKRWEGKKIAAAGGSSSYKGEDFREKSLLYGGVLKRC